MADSSAFTFGAGNLTNSIPPLYMALSDVTITNTTTESSTFSSSYIGAKTIAANRLNAGTTIMITGGGLYSVPLASVGNLTVKIKFGGNTITSVVITTLAVNMTNAAFQFDCALVCRSTGTSGTIAPVGGLNFATTAGGRVYADLLNSGADSTINTAISNAVDVTVQWQTASTSRSITVRGTVVTLIN